MKSLAELQAIREKTLNRINPSLFRNRANTAFPPLPAMRTASPAAAVLLPFPSPQ